MLKKSIAQIARRAGTRSLATTSFQRQNNQLTPIDHSQSIAAYVDGLSKVNGQKYDKIIDPSTNQELSDTTSSMKEIINSSGSLKLRSSETDSEVILMFPKLQEEDRLRLLAKELVTSLGDLSVNQRLNDIDAKIEEVDRKLLPLEETYDKILKEADDKTDNLLVVFLGGSTVSFFTIARLTWWEYSWDIMEPVAWAAQAGGMLFWGWYYFITRSENSMTAISDRLRNKKFRKRMEKEGDFSIETYNELVMARKRLEKEYLKIKEHS